MDAIAQAHRKDPHAAQSSAEYLSGFHKSDRVWPVITLVLYFGSDPWDGPRDLHSMMRTRPEFLRFAPNDQINLIAPNEMSDDALESFTSELRIALKYIKYERNKDRLQQVMREDDAFQHASRDTVDLQNEVTGSRLRYNEREETVDMCLAIEELCNEREARGRAEGRTEGACPLASLMNFRQCRAGDESPQSPARAKRSLRGASGATA